MRYQWRQHIAGIIHGDGSISPWPKINKPSIPQASPHLHTLDMDRFRSALRAFTNPVVAVMTSDNSEEERVSQPLAVTINSFSTVTMNPVPYIAFNLRSNSRVWSAIEQNKRFEIIVFKDTADAATILQEYTKADKSIVRPFSLTSEEGSIQRNACARSQKDGLEPEFRIQHSSLLFTLVCHLDRGKCLAVGDHVLVLATVSNMRNGENTEGETALSYAMGDFRSAGPVVEPLTTKLRPAPRVPYAQRRP